MIGLPIPDGLRVKFEDRGPVWARDKIVTAQILKIDRHPDAVKQGVTYKGKVYGIPYGLDTRFLYYRKDVFQKAGLDPNWQPKNVQDILDTARQIQGKVPDVIPYVIYAGKNGDTGTANHGFVPTLWAFGG